MSLLLDEIAVATARLAEAGVESPRTDAELIAAHVHCVTRGALATVPDASFDPRFWDEVARREAREPLQHITGHAYFRYLDLEVGPGVFVPRQETEVMTGWAIDRLTEMDVAEPLVADLGTGSAAIALAIAQEVPRARVHAVEADPLARQWAERNIARYAVAAPHLAGRVSLHAGDFCTALVRPGQRAMGRCRRARCDQDDRGGREQAAASQGPGGRRARGTAGSRGLLDLPGGAGLAGDPQSQGPGRPGPVRHGRAGLTGPRCAVSPCSSRPTAASRPARIGVPAVYVAGWAAMSRRFDCADASERAAGVAAALVAVRRGDLIVLPTDTVYGIGADAFRPDAVTALLEAKGRGRSMPPPVLVGTVRAAIALIDDLGPYGKDLIDEFWPGGLTLVCPAAPTLQWDLGDTRGTVAVRMPLHPVALELLKETGPLAVSSANRTGSLPATTAADAEEQFGDAVAVYLDGGECAGPASSTIVDLTGGLPRLLRKGVVPVERLREVANVSADEDAAPYS